MVIIHNGTGIKSNVNDKTASTLVKGGRYRYENDVVTLTAPEALTYIDAKIRELAEREAAIEERENQLLNLINKTETNGSIIKEIGDSELRQPKRRGRKSK